MCLSCKGGGAVLLNDFFSFMWIHLLILFNPNIVEKTVCLGEHYKMSGGKKHSFVGCNLKGSVFDIRVNFNWPNWAPKNGQVFVVTLY